MILYLPLGVNTGIAQPTFGPVSLSYGYVFHFKILSTQTIVKLQVVYAQLFALYSTRILPGVGVYDT